MDLTAATLEVLLFIRLFPVVFTDFAIEFSQYNKQEHDGQRSWPVVERKTSHSTVIGEHNSFLF